MPEEPRSIGTAIPRPGMAGGAILVIRRRRPIGESLDLEPGSTPGAAVLRGSFGAGRILQALRELRLPPRTVIQSVIDADPDATQIDRLDVGRLFVSVVLGSHLVNVPDDRLRHALLEAARRHLVGDCDVLIEHHPIDWATTAADVRPTPGGSQPGMTDVRREPPFVSAVSVYDVGGRVVRQPFTARVLSEEELVAELRSAGLLVRSRLSPTWILAGPITPRTWPADQVMEGSAPPS